MYHNVPDCVGGNYRCMNNAGLDKNKSELNELKGKNPLAIPLILIFFLMVVMVAYTSQNVRSVTVRNIHEVGYDKLTSVCAQIKNYLDTTKGMLWLLLRQYGFVWLRRR